MDRASAKWMKREDDRILELLEKEGLARPSLISRKAFGKVSPGHVSERLAMLRHTELVAKTGLSSYELTEAGQRYLGGELDAAHQPRPTVGRVLRG